MVKVYDALDAKLTDKQILNNITEEIYRFYIYVCIIYKHVWIIQTLLIWV